MIISQFCKVDPKQSSPREAFKLLFMLLELLAMECDNAAVAGLFWVVDARDVSMEQMLQYDPFLLKKSFMFVDQCLPLRFAEIHLVNMIPSGQTVFNFVTSFLPAKLPWKVSCRCLPIPHLDIYSYRSLFILFSRTVRGAQEVRGSVQASAARGHDH